MSIDQAIADAAAEGARQALAAHVPRLALTVTETAKATGAGVTTVRRWVTDGHLARVPHTDRVLIPVASIEAFVLSAGASTSAGNLTPAEVNGPSDSTAADLSGSTAPPLSLARPAGDRSPTSTADGGTHPPSAA